MCSRRGLSPSHWDLQDLDRCLFAQWDGHRIGCCQILQASSRLHQICFQILTRSLSMFQQPVRLSDPAGIRRWLLWLFPAGKLFGRRWTAVDSSTDSVMTVSTWATWATKAVFRCVSCLQALYPDTTARFEMDGEPVPCPEPGFKFCYVGPWRHRQVQAGAPLVMRHVQTGR